MAREVEQIASGVITGPDHIIDTVIDYVVTALQALPIAGWR
jgi:hypothetical protein